MNLLFGDLNDDRDGHFAMVHNDSSLIMEPLLNNLGTAVCGVGKILLDRGGETSHVRDEMETQSKDAR